MTRGTTPTIVMELPESILSSLINEAVFSIFQHGKEVVQRRLEEMDANEKENTLSVRLTQEETYSLKAYEEILMQLKIKIGDTVLVSNVMKGCVFEVLNKEVI